MIDNISNRYAISYRHAKYYTTDFKDKLDLSPFPHFLEKKGSRESIDHASGIIIRKPDRDLTLQALEKEIRYLRFL
jgi:hypothetical protein